jgi:hypothetical protein
MTAVKTLVLIGAALVAMAIPRPGLAQLSPGDRQAASKMVEGRLYLKIDAPCDHGREVPMVEVSPTSVDLETRISELTPENRPNLFWRFGPNDAAHDTVLRFGLDRIRVWSEGVSPKNDQFMIEFVRIKTLDDFRKAFDLAFSRVPLQDAHPEWPAEVRQAIAARRLIEGMTPEQARAVIGAPTRVEASQEAGTPLETWYPRQENGVRKVFRNATLSTGFPKSLKFVGGKLVVIEK